MRDWFCFVLFCFVFYLKYSYAPFKEGPLCKYWNLLKHINSGYLMTFEKSVHFLYLSLRAGAVLLVQNEALPPCASEYRRSW